MIRLQDVSLYFGERILFERLSFTISPGEKLAICGRNGSGKSTLFKLILREITPDKGIIEIPNQLSIGYLRQELPKDNGYTLLDEVLMSIKHIQELQDESLVLDAELKNETLAENVIIDILHRMEDIRLQLEHFEASKIEGKAEKILIGLGFKQYEFGQKVSEFSGGWRMRIEMAKLLLSQPNVLLLDEPNNHLDIISLRWLEKYLRDYEGTVILISHDLRFLDNFARRIIELDRGKMYDFKGNYSAYKTYRAERKAIETNEYNAQQRIIQHKEQLIEKFRYKASKAAFAQSLITELNRMDKKELPDEEQSYIQLRFKSSLPSGRKVLEIKNANKYYGEKLIIKDVNLYIEKGSRISFIGANGNGKTSLVKMICAKTETSGGLIETGHQVKIGYYAQEHDDELSGDLTALQVVEMSAIAEMRNKVRKVLGGLGFSGEDADKKISVLSGGEKARIRLAMLIVNEHNFLILDEPTHHLDLPSKERLKESLQHYDGTILLVSHDREFLKGLADKTVLFENNGIRTFEGDIEYYLEKTEETNIYELSKKPESQRDEFSKANDVNQFNHKKSLQRRIQNLEKEILKLEEQLEVLHLKLSDPEFYMSKEYQDTIFKYQELKIKLETKTTEWNQAIAQLH